MGALYGACFCGRVFLALDSVCCAIAYWLVAIEGLCSLCSLLLTVYGGWLLDFSCPLMVLEIETAAGMSLCNLSTLKTVTKCLYFLVGVETRSYSLLLNK